MIHETIRATIPLNLSDGRLAHWANLELFAECPSECVGSKTAHPVRTTTSELYVSIARVIVKPNITGYGSVDGVSQIVFVVTVPI